MPFSANTAVRSIHVDALSLLIERVVDGDEQALASLYDGTATAVQGLALRILGDRQHAEEVALDVYLQAWRQAATFDRTRGTPIAWLLTMARSRAIDRLRSRTSRPSGSAPLEAAQAESSDAEGPDEEAAFGQRRRIVIGALSRLSHDERATIELAYFRGLSHSEIATELDMPLGTVKTRIRLGMLRLKKVLAQHGRELL